MNRLTVIEGGGKGGPKDSGWTRDGFHGLAIELLRGLARGKDSSNVTVEEMCRLAVGVGKDADLLGRIIAEELEKLHGLIFPDKSWSKVEPELAAIIKAALRMAAERMCRDAAAAGRASKAEGRLRTAVMSFARNEMKARGGGI